MRASLLLLAFATLLITTPATNGQTHSRRSGMPDVKGKARPPRDGDRGGPYRPGKGHRPVGPGMFPGDRHGKHHGHGHHGHWNHWPGMSKVPWWYWYYCYPQYWPRHGYHHGHHPRPYWRPASYERYYRGSNIGEQQLPSVTSPPISTPSPYGTDAYAGDPSAYGVDPYATDPYASENNLYAEDLISQSVYAPYYETDPVQFAYTPADIPPRAAVVRPNRTTLVSLVVPSQARTPLYGLVVMPRTTTDTSGPLVSGEGYLSEVVAN